MNEYEIRRRRERNTIGDLYVNHYDKTGNIVSLPYNVQQRARQDVDSLLRNRDRSVSDPVVDKRD